MVNFNTIGNQTGKQLINTTRRDQARQQTGHNIRHTIYGTETIKEADAVARGQVPSIFGNAKNVPEGQLLEIFPKLKPDELNITLKQGGGKFQQQKNFLQLLDNGYPDGVTEKQLKQFEAAVSGHSPFSKVLKDLPETMTDVVSKSLRRLK